MTSFKFMILYLYGPDSYRRGAVLRDKILASFSKKHPDGLVDYFDLEKDDELDRTVGFSRSAGLFASFKLGVLTNPGEAEEKSLIELLKSYLEDKDTTLVLICEKKLGKKFDFLLKPPVQSWAFDLLSEREVTSFIKKRAGELEFELKTEEIKDLIVTFGTDLWVLSQELEKMALGGAVENEASTPEFIDSIKGFVYGRSVKDKLRALHFLLNKNDAGAIFNMASAWAGGGSKVVFANYDGAVKGGKLEYEEALLDFALK